jgi:hypothetical protein
VGLAALITIGGAAVAPAHITGFPTTFEAIRFVDGPGSRGTFEGQIGSTKAKCLKGRTVRFEQQLGATASSLDSTKTEDDGTFTHEVLGVRSQEFRAQVVKKSLPSTGDHRHKCKAKVVSFTG